MELGDLSIEDRVLLAGLVRLIVGADESNSPLEMEEFRAIAEEMGRRSFDIAFREALGEVGTVAQAMALARAVVSPASRQLIFTVLTDLANADGMDESDRLILAELAEVWGLTLRG